MSVAIYKENAEKAIKMLSKVKCNSNNDSEYLHEALAELEKIEFYYEENFISESIVKALQSLQFTIGSDMEDNDKINEATAILTNIVKEIHRTESNRQAIS